jgi:hypothetical protein
MIMCTVTYLPVGKEDFILTHNRDEQSVRGIASMPEIRDADGLRTVYPVDPKGHGTWIGMADNGKAACLLNGGFERHIPDPPYKHSRGLVILHLFSFPGTSDFIDKYEFSRLEPFTLVVYDRGSLYEIVWDGQKVHAKNLPVDQPHIYSSTSLYEPAVREKRHQWFRQWLEEHPTYRINDIRNFHNYGGEGDSATNLVMKREEGLQTVSITSIQKRDGRLEMIHHDLIRDLTNCLVLMLTV